MTRIDKVFAAGLRVDLFAGFPVSEYPGVCSAVHLLFCRTKLRQYGSLPNIATFS